VVVVVRSGKKVGISKRRRGVYKNSDMVERGVARTANLLNLGEKKEDCVVSCSTYVRLERSHMATTRIAI